MISHHYEISGAENKIITIDVHAAEKNKKKAPVIIFSHGFKGFKDWGTFNLIAEWFASKGMAFVKFNFSHNGVTPQAPTEFTDLQAFAENTFSKEIKDLGKVIDFVLSEEIVEKHCLDPQKLSLIGHSRGGGISILKAAEDLRVRKLVTWGSVSDFEKGWTSDLVNTWETEGHINVLNHRTCQEMPVNYTLYEDYQKHRDKLYIQTAIIKMAIPFLIVHGRNDETIGVNAAYDMNDWNKDFTELFIVEDANHVFGAKHPWLSPKLPDPTEEILHKTLNFLLN